MKINEIITNTKQVQTVQPSSVKKQNKVGKVMAQIAASDAQQKPTEMDKVAAMRAYSDLKKRNDKLYAERLRQQLAKANAAIR